MGSDLVTNVTTETSSILAYTSEVYRVVVPIMLGACLVSILFNAIILLSALWIRRSLSPTLCFSLSLAVADAYASLVVGIGLVVNSLLPIVYGTDLGEHHICYVLVLEALRLAGLIASVLHLLALSVNHYVGILRPLHYAAIVTRRAALLTISLMWFFPVAFFLVYFGSVPNQGFQSPLCSATHFLLYSPFRITTSALFFVPLPLMTGMYSHIFIVVRRHQRGLVQYASSSRHLRKNVKATITSVLILGTYLVGWMPAVLLFAFTCLDCPFPFKDIPYTTMVPMAVLSNILIVLKSLVDPVVYAARMPEIKDALALMVKNRCVLSRTGSLSTRTNTILSRTDTLTSSLRLVSFRKASKNGSAVHIERSIHQIKSKPPPCQL